MKNDSINENQNIQEGLEKFLDEQLIFNKEKKSSNDSIDLISGVNSQISGLNNVNTWENSNNRVEDNYNRDNRGNQYDKDDMDDWNERRSSQSSNRKPRENERERDSDRKRDREKEKERSKKKSKSRETGRKRGNDKMSKGKKKQKNSLKTVFIFLLVLLLLLAGLWYILIGNAYKKMEYQKSDVLADGVLKKDGVTNILLIGSDARSNEESGRSDAMILLSISNKTKTIHMTSLLRDMYVEIPGKGGNRLNAAYSYGGEELLVETIKQNLGIEVNRFMVVNFFAFANLVDAVGGVDLELSNEEVQWVNAYLNEYNLLQDLPIETNYLDTSLSGMIHLNGPQALAYSRNRYIGTDFGRTERQRKVLGCVMKKLPIAVATNSGELVDGLLPNLTTNLTQAETYQLSLDGGKLATYEVIQNTIPLEGTYKNATIREMAVLEVDFEANKEYIQKEIYGKE